jgi:hypothetical protein
LGAPALFESHALLATPLQPQHFTAQRLTKIVAEMICASAHDSTYTVGCGTSAANGWIRVENVEIAGPCKKLNGIPDIAAGKIRVGTAAPRLSGQAKPGSPGIIGSMGSQ